MFLTSSLLPSAVKISRQCFRSSMYILTQRRYMSSEPAPKPKLVEVNFVKANGERITAKGKIGDSLLDVVVNNNIDLDGYGACEGTLTCSTCHVILKESDFEGLPDKPTDEECDMLDLAFEVCDTSRLGCQIILSEKLNGLEVKLPASINDVRSS